MPLHLTEDDVGRLLTMPDCIEALERIFGEWAAGKASVKPRQRTAIEGALLHVLSAASQGLGRMAVKAYASTRAGAHFVVLLFDARSSELLAIIEADRLGQIRTGAASGLATRWLARKEETTLGLLGTGWQARSQVQAIACVRKVSSIRAYGRDRERLTSFCREVEAACGLPTTPAPSAEAAVRGAGIVVTATNSATPVLKGDWLEPGMHLNAVGNNRAERRELDERAVRRADLLVVDYLEQARLEAGDLLVSPCDAAEQGIFEKAVELSAIIAGRHAGRVDAQQITLFKSLGIGLEDLAAASLVYERATTAGAGRRLEEPVRR